MNITNMKMRRIMLLWLATASFALLPVRAKAHALTDSADSSGSIASTAAAPLDLTYTRPTERTKILNYLFEAYGPYPAAGAIAAGIPGVELHRMHLNNGRGAPNPGINP
jgi:hypothetical protein